MKNNQTLTRRIFRAIKWLSIISAECWLCYNASVNGSKGSYNVLLFVSVVGAIAHLMLLHPEEKKRFEQRGPAVPDWLFTLGYSALVGGLAHQGFLWIAAAQLFIGTVQHYVSTGHDKQEI